MDVLVWNVRPCSDKGFDTRDLSYEEEDTFMISIDMYNNDVGKRFMKQTGALGPHPLFCFISFIGIYYPLTDIVFPLWTVLGPPTHKSGTGRPGKAPSPWRPFGPKCDNTYVRRWLCGARMRLPPRTKSLFEAHAARASIHTQIGRWQRQEHPETRADALAAATKYKLSIPML